MLNTAYRNVRGPLEAVICDWAGTIIDHGSRAPVAAILEAFSRRGVAVTPQEARGPMGRPKPDHIRAVASLPAVSERWTRVHGSPPDVAAIDSLYRDFLPLELDIVAGLSDLIPGAREAAEACRARGLKLGSCTGYSRAIMDVIVPRAAEQGFSVDALVCPEDVGGGRPHPWMIWQNAVLLSVSSLAVCVKVGDTPVDIEEGLNAGCWTVAVARSGNELGLSDVEAAAVPARELEQRLITVRQRLLAGGAHVVIDTIAELPVALDQIAQRLGDGERP